MEEAIITAKRKRSDRSSQSDKSSQSLSKTLRAITKEAEKTVPKEDRMEDDLIEELMNLDMNKKKEARPMIRLTKRRKTIALDELFGKIKLEPPAPRKTEKKTKVAKHAPTRVSARVATVPKSKSLPKLSPINIPVKTEELKEYANKLMLMVKELKAYEKQMKELDVLLPKMLRATNKGDLLRMKALLRETNLKDVIEYVKRKEPLIVDLRRLCEKGDAAIQLMALQYAEYRETVEATKSEKALYLRKLRKMYTFLDEYQKRFVEELYPLTERVLNHIKELNDWRRSAVTTKENEDLTNLLTTLNL